jgi:uncharacterized protein YjbI with pentapeptide repeats
MAKVQQRGGNTAIDLSKAEMSASTGAVWSSAKLRAALEAGDVSAFNAHRPKEEKKNLIDLRGIDLSGKDLSGIDLSYCDLRGANLNQCILRGAHCEWATATGAFFNGTLLDDAHFENATLESTKFENVRSARGADFHSAEMAQASFDNSNFEGVSMQEVKAFGASLNKAVFRDAFLYKARFNRSSGKLADFSGKKTVLVGAHFKQAALSQANFSNANAYFASFSQSNGVDLNFAGTNLVKADMRKTVFAGKTTFEGAYVQEMRYDRSSPFGMKTEEAKKLLAAARNEEPAKGVFVVGKSRVAESSLIMGIPNTNKGLMLEAKAFADTLIGMDGPKAALFRRQTKIRNNLRRQQHGKKVERVSLNTLLIGPTGTGKTTFAELEAMTDCALGLIKSPDAMIRHRDECITDNIGGTEKLAKAIAEEALDTGRRLVIDEIYQLIVAESGKDFGKSALNVFMRFAEQYRKDFALTGILYPEEVATLRRYNQGFLRRFPNKIIFPHYNDGQLVDQLRWRMDTNEDIYDKQILLPASVMFALQREKEGDAFGNGAAARDLMELMGEYRSFRLDEIEEVTGDQLSTYVPDDIPFEDILGFDESELDYEQLTWVTHDGQKELDHKGVTRSFKQFPRLTAESITYLVDTFGERFPLQEAVEEE